MLKADDTRQEIRDRFLEGEITQAEADRELSLVYAIERKPRLVRSQSLAYRQVLRR